jgi:hypothetical protein
MSDSPTRPPQGALARGLKLIGRLTSPETRSGKVFTQAEERLTQLTSRLAESPTWLRVSGALLSQGLRGRIRRHALQERLLRALRMPPASEVEALREQLRHINDQVEALGSQLELVVELLERQQRPPAPREGPLAEPRPREPVPRKSGA